MLPQWENSQLVLHARPSFLAARHSVSRTQCWSAAGICVSWRHCTPLTEGDENAATAPTLTAAGADMHTKRNDV
jgi:hypothetical protein